MRQDVPYFIQLDKHPAPNQDKEGERRRFVALERQLGLSNGTIGGHSLILFHGSFCVIAKESLQTVAA